jgi:hypothetical protein
VQELNNVMWSRETHFGLLQHTRGCTSELPVSVAAAVPREERCGATHALQELRLFDSFSLEETVDIPVI